MTAPTLFPSYASCVAKALRASRRPLSIDELVVAVAKERPIGKRVEAAVYRAINGLYQAVPTGENKYGWLTHLLDGTNVCHPLTGEEISGGFLLLDELEHTVFFPRFFEQFQADARVVTVSLFDGPVIESAASIQQNTWSLQLGPQFVQWLDELGVENRDDMIISVVDADAGYYDVRPRLREMRDNRILEERNIRLAMLSEEIVVGESTVRSTMPTWDLAARLIGRGFFKDSNPSDDLHYVLSEYSILQFIEGEGYHLAQAPQTSAPDPIYSVDEARSILGDLLSEWQQRESLLNKLTANSIDDSLPEIDGDQLHRKSCDLSMAAEDCPAYQEYLKRVEYEMNSAPSLNHEQFHLLEAEMNMLFQLELRYGTLLPEQQQRIDQLSSRLSLNSGSHESVDWGLSDDANVDDAVNRH